MFGRWFYLWCILACTVLVTSMLHYVHIRSESLHLFDSNRWIHFFVYAAMIAMPVAAWQRGPASLLSLSPVFVSIALDSFASDPSFADLRPQIIPAELFGVAAGLLLGLNLRVMHKAQIHLKAGTEKPSSPAAF